MLALITGELKRHPAAMANSTASTSSTATSSLGRTGLGWDGCQPDRESVPRFQPCLMENNTALCLKTYRADQNILYTVSQVEARAPTRVALQFLHPRTAQPDGFLHDFLKFPFFDCIHAICSPRGQKGGEDCTAIDSGCIEKNPMMAEPCFDDGATRIFLPLWRQRILIKLLEKFANISKRKGHGGCA